MRENGTQALALLRIRFDLGSGSAGPSSKTRFDPILVEVAGMLSFGGLYPFSGFMSGTLSAAGHSFSVTYQKSSSSIALWDSSFRASSQALSLPAGAVEAEVEGWGLADMRGFILDRNSVGSADGALLAGPVPS